MATTVPLLEVQKLCVRRGATTLLRDLSWTVQPGEHWVIMGPNGGGKTSLLRVLTGFLSPSAGEVNLLGATFGQSDWREVRARIGLVSSALQASIPPAEPAVETVISGRYAQLDFWGTATATDNRDAQRRLRHLGIGRLADRPWLYLSQGERQRVLIARALMASPSLLILDEPCAGLDPLARRDFLAHVDALARQPGSPGLVLVTHHVEEITPTFTHVLLLRAGRCIAAGPRRNVLTSGQLSRAFGAHVRLRRHGETLGLKIERT